MRRWKKEIKDKAIVIDLLNICHAGRSGTVGKDGYPMENPLNGEKLPSEDSLPFANQNGSG